MDSLPDAPTPLPQSRTPAVAPRSKEAKPPLKFSNAEPPALASPEVRDVVEHTAKRGEEPQAEDDQAPQASYDDEGDKTIMLNKPPVSVTSPSPPPQTSSPISSAKAGLPETPARNARFGNVPVTPAETPGPSTTATPGTGKSSRMKVTSDMERIVVRFLALRSISWSDSYVGKTLVNCRRRYHARTSFQYCDCCYAQQTSARERDHVRYPRCCSLAQ